MQQSFNIQQIDPQQFEAQVYSTEDTQIISQFEISEIFDATKDYVEYFVYDANRELLQSSTDSPYTSYRIYDNQIAIDPQQDIVDEGYYSGQYYTVYNFLTNLLASNSDNKFFISEVSSDRTEIRLDTTTIANDLLIAGANDLIDRLTNNNYYFDFYLNFGDNKLIIANNIALDQSDPQNPTILIKLYEPLPSEFDIKTELWVVENLTDPVGYSIDITVSFDDEPIGIQLRGPNLNLGIGDTINTSDTYYNFETLNQTTQAVGTGSLQYNINSILEERGIEINIDYSDYSNFIHFSSAQARLENFYYKLSLIEQYQASASLGTNNNTYISGAQALWESRINNIITNFDGYEYYLYYTSASTAWPKVNDTPPFVNYTTTSTSGSEWLTAQLITASNYDESNKDALVYAIPPYLRDDPNNSQFELFVEMIGQHFDIVWTYTKDITNRYNADNRLDYGISKDLIADVLRDLGIKIYQNNFSTQNLYSTLLGITPSGSLLNIPNSTLTLPAPTGYEYITSYVTASAPYEAVPLEDANKQLYKRIYHNLPLLLKKKGTTAGLKLLLNLYGIPDTILRINEFGGQDTLNVDDWDNWQDTFNYALSTKDSIGNDIYGTAPWRNLTTTNKTPQTIEFRFKTTEFPPTHYTSSLAAFVSSSGTTYLSQGFILEYTGSGYTSASYSGSTVDPYYQYATLKYVSQSVSASVYLPIYNGDWWSVGLTLQSGSTAYTASLYAKQKGTYVGDSYIKHEASSSVILANVPSASSFLVLPGNTNLVSDFTYGGGKVATPIQSASFQELRYYSIPISESVFDDYVMNPYSIEGSSTEGANSSYNTLLYRIDLGTSLNRYHPIVSSSHPSVTGSNPTQSFVGASSDYVIATSGLDLDSSIYTTNTEYIYQKQPNAGIQVAVSDKIKLSNTTLPIGNTLSPYKSIQQSYTVSQSYTSDVNYVEVAFSPQDEINDDIIDQLGYFNIGQYIGDPRFESSSATSYPDLDTLRNDYFKKYIRNYDMTDYLRLIKFFDNSLFKMIKDFVPARTGLATGAVIKQHLLERNRQRPPQASWEDQTYSGSVTTLSTGYDTGSKVYTFSGSTGGTLPSMASYTSSGYYPPFINISQSWSETVITPSGSNIIIHDNLEEFYDGQFKGTTITITTQSLVDEDCRSFLDVNVDETLYIPVFYNYQITKESTFLAQEPALGEINIYYAEDDLEEGYPNNNLPID